MRSAVVVDARLADASEVDALMPGRASGEQYIARDVGDQVQVIVVRHGILTGQAYIAAALPGRWEGRSS